MRTGCGGPQLLKDKRAKVGGAGWRIEGAGHWSCDRQSLKGCPSEVKHGTINDGEVGSELLKRSLSVLLARLRRVTLKTPF